MQDDAWWCKMMQDDDDDDDDDDDNDYPMILNIRAKNHTSERTIVPWTVIFYQVVVYSAGDQYFSLDPIHMRLHLL